MRQKSIVANRQKTAVGKIATDKETAFIDVKLPKHLWAKVDRIAALTKRTSEQVCYDALAGFIEKIKHQSDTFRLSPSLAMQLAGAAAMMTATPAWFIQEALISLITSSNEDGTVRSDCQDNFHEEKRRKVKCQVTALERSSAK